MENSSRPSSPGHPPVSLRGCIEEALKFLFSAEILGADLGLSREYCFLLLKEDDHCGSSGAEYPKGLPIYPLYRSLASSLYDCMTTGTFCRTSSTMMLVQESENVNEKANEWRKLIMNKGSEFINIVKKVDFELHVQEPFFSQLRAGLKTVEGRCAVGDYKSIGPGNFLLINKCLLLEVQHVKWYASFLEMIEAVDIVNVLPGIQTIEEGVQVYRKFYTEEKEQTNGVLAIFVSRSDVQPFMSIASIIQGLSYDGTGSLLGLMHTDGTIPDALPPPLSSLLSSFTMSYKPNVKGGCLTSGARALSKHVSRSSSGWWGNFDGSDSNKNMLAVKAVSHIINRCCWMNIHVVQPHDCVFEVRVAEGYGARWSQDGSKFIGFLEPYMEDGHSKGWKH